jgi:hypothetical protein
LHANQPSRNLTFAEEGSSVNTVFPGNPWAPQLTWDVAVRLFVIDLPTLERLAFHAFHALSIPVGLGFILTIMDCIGYTISISRLDPGRSCLS